MKQYILLPIVLLLISCDKKDEPIFLEGSEKLHGTYHGFINYTGPSGSHMDYHFATVKFIEKNLYTINFEDLDLPIIEIEVDKSVAGLIIKFNVTNDGWQDPDPLGYQCNYFQVFEESRGSSQDVVVLCISASGSTVNFKFNGKRPW